jgi:hypothetical protein
MLLEETGTSCEAEVISTWFGNYASRPAVVVHPQTVEDIVAVMRDKAKCPAPVRAVGSSHSVSAVIDVQGSTAVAMRQELPGLRSQALEPEGESIMMYLDPFRDRVVLERRRYNEGKKSPRRPSKLLCKIRNFARKDTAPYISEWRATFTFAPNFAYVMATKQTKDEELAALDLSTL